MTENTINTDVTMGGATGALLAGRYRVVRQLGQGGMGSVWLAEDTKLDGFKVAIKMLPSVLVNNKRAYAQVKAEALVSLKLSHPNIVTVRAFEEEGGSPFLVMDYIDGQTLDDYLAEKGKLTEEETVKLLKPVAAALDYAHTQGVVHRDVKPGNVMIRKDGVPFVLDFGIAREIQETMTRVTGKLSSGTLLYMSPEQLHGAAPKPAQDIYSFAAMAYECLSGQPPFSRGQIEYQIEHDTPEPLDQQFAKCGSGVMAGLAKSSEARPATCVAVLMMAAMPPTPLTVNGTWGVTKAHWKFIVVGFGIFTAVGACFILCQRSVNDQKLLVRVEDNSIDPFKESVPSQIKDDLPFRTKEISQSTDADQQEAGACQRQEADEHQELMCSRRVIEKITYEFDIATKTWSVAGCEKDVGGEVTVRNEIKGFKIARIEKEAFRDCSDMTCVALPSGVTFIGEYAFRNCEGLTEVKYVGKYESPHDLQAEEQSSLTAWSIDSAAFYGCKNLKRVMIPPAVTKIGNDVFRDCKGLIEVTIPGCVTSIGNNAFYGCGDLKGVNLPLGLREIGEHAFCDCKGLDRLIIPSGVTSIGFCAFHGCDGLKSLVLPSSVKTIATYAFAYCSKLTNVSIPSGKIGNCAFEGCSKLSVLKISPDVTEIGSRAFSRCNGLTRVEISATASVGERAFGGCVGLAILILTPGVTGIGEGAFYECERLKSVTIPSSVSAIGEEAFSHCEGLKSVTISKGVKTIGPRAFYWCTSLSAVMLPSSVENIESGAFEACSGLTQVTLSRGLTSIEKDVFRGCRSLKSVMIPEGVTDIGEFAFCGCDGLQEVSIPSSVTGIGDYAFNGCRGLTNVTIPQGVVRIDERAFSNCEGLTSVILPASVESLDEEAFDSGVKIIRK